MRANGSFGSKADVTLTSHLGGKLPFVATLHTANSD